MGEYARYNQRQIKIGTCESMYYLRASQASMVQPLSGSCDPMKDAESIRFRFPFPDEDEVEPGAFEPYNRTVGLHGVAIPEGVKHYTAQFSNPRGYLISLPCPEQNESDNSPLARKLHFQRNNNPGGVRISQQRLVEGKLVLICECGGCGAAYRLQTVEECKPIFVALEEMAVATERCNSPSTAEFYREIARRILAGYRLPNLWTAKQ